MDWQYWTGIVAAAVAGIGGGAASVYFYVRRSLNDVRKTEDATAVSSWRELMEYKSEDFRKKSVEYDAMLVRMRNEMNAMHDAHMRCEREGMEREIEFKRITAEKEIEFKRITADMQDKLKSLETQMQSLSSKQDASASKAVDIAVIAAAQVVGAKVDTQAIERLKVHEEQNKEQARVNAEEIQKLKDTLNKSAGT
jgi:hypothetical protein